MREPRIKYILCPGLVQSQNDGDQHYVTSLMLARLYGVDPRECLVMVQEVRFGNRNPLLDHRGYYVGRSDEYVGVPRLSPQSSGDYRLPTGARNSVDPSSSVSYERKVRIRRP